MLEWQSVLWNTVLPLLAATGLGALVGYERETVHQPAGLRTHMMVGLGACSFTIIALALFRELAAGDTDAAMDPIRIIEGVVGGIGFLGAGSILRSGGEIRGITTAAGIWVMGAIGAACAVQAYAIAVSTAVLALITLAVVRRVAGNHAEEDEKGLHPGSSNG